MIKAKRWLLGFGRILALADFVPIAFGQAANPMEVMLNNHEDGSHSRLEKISWPPCSLALSIDWGHVGKKRGIQHSRLRRFS